MNVLGKMIFNQRLVKCDRAAMEWVVSIGSNAFNGKTGYLA